ncbi:MAG TPA: redoxin family protein [Candidatus Binataceae bacterium]|nr:redoxin family protein [Candidatus Binataceae bacterium]
MTASPLHDVAPPRSRRLRFVVGGLALAVLVAAGLGAYFAQRQQSDRSAAERGGSALPFAREAKPRAVPEFRFQDEAGRPLSLADFRGKVVLLNIWATWCPPCRKEMPTLDRLQAKLGGSDFQVVALSIDEKGASAVRAFFQEIGVRALKIYVDPSMRATTALGVPGVPTTLLIDRSGREIGRHLGPADWDSAPVVQTLRERIGTKNAAGGSS